MRKTILTALTVTAGMTLIAACSADDGGGIATAPDTAQNAAPDTSLQDALAAVEQGEYARAATLLSPHAEGGNAEAQFRLAGLHMEARMDGADPQTGMRWLEKAATGGHVRAQAIYGPRLINTATTPEDTAKGVAFLQAAAQSDNIPALVQMGFLHEHGKGVDADQRSAARYYMRAAVLGSTEGRKRLDAIAEAEPEAAGVIQAVALREGFGGAADPDAAVMRLQTAAEAGDALAQFEMSQLYGTGQHVKRDLVQAYHWANMAAAQNHEGATDRRDVWAQLMTEDQIAEGQALARDAAFAD